MIRSHRTRHRSTSATAKPEIPVEQKLPLGIEPEPVSAGTILDLEIAALWVIGGHVPAQLAERPLGHIAPEPGRQAVRWLVDRGRWCWQPLRARCDAVVRLPVGKRQVSPGRADHRRRARAAASWP